jgi:hypothetical protein
VTLPTAFQPPLKTPSNRLPTPSNRVCVNTPLYPRTGWKDRLAVGSPGPPTGGKDAHAQLARVKDDGRAKAALIAVAGLLRKGASQ